MILFKKLGNYGRLGNQLFQIASTTGIALKNNTGYFFPEWQYNHMCKRGIPTLPNCRDLAAIDYNGESHFEYRDLTFSQVDNINLLGYFQTEKYFAHCRNRILNMLELNSVYADKINELNIDFQNCVSVHVRRGDYVNLPNHHPVLPLEYYQTCMSKFMFNHMFLLFTDDIEWCLKQSLFNNSHVIPIHTGNDFLDLHIMSHCKHNIIANSSYSWWGAWLNLNESKNVYAPKHNWFGTALSHLNTQDLLPDNWIKL